MSHVMDNQLTILKRDARGRVRSTAEARGGLLPSFGAAGKKMPGIMETRFAAFNPALMSW